MAFRKKKPKVKNFIPASADGDYYVFDEISAMRIRASDAVIDDYGYVTHYKHLDSTPPEFLEPYDFKTVDVPFSSPEPDFEFLPAPSTSENWEAIDTLWEAVSTNWESLT